MKKNLTKLIIVAILISTLNPIANTSQAKAKTKKIICLSLKGNTLTSVSYTHLICKDLKISALL